MVPNALSPIARVARVVGGFALFGWLGVAALVVTGPATWSSLAYVAALGLFALGLATLPDGGVGGAGAWRPRGLCRAALATVALVGAGRACATARAGEGPGAMHLSDGEGGSGKVVNRLVDEADVAMAGARVLVNAQTLHDDRAALLGAMRGAYADMRRERGDVPSPVLGTYLGLERPSAFDVVMIEPEGPPRGALVFLHGYAGNFALPCWQLARAVGPLGVVTACPSTRWVGDWGSERGEATLKQTVAMLRARGLERVVLAGLSNGAIGASTLAPRMKGTFAGLVLVSGVDRDAPSAGMPTLVLHGRHDTMTSPDDARAYAARTRASYVVLEAGHFAMLVRAPEADRAVRAFVAARL